MDPSDKAGLDALTQSAARLLSQGHVDVGKVIDHSFYVGAIFWLVIGTIIVASIYFRFKSRSERMKLLQTLAEKGQAIPPELLLAAGLGVKERSVNYVARGILLVSVGLAMILFFLAAGGAFSGAMGRGDIAPVFAGAFPLFLGLGYLGIGLYQRRHG
jgi:hypothetical protein